MDDGAGLDSADIDYIEGTVDPGAYGDEDADCFDADDDDAVDLAVAVEPGYADGSEPEGFHLEVAGDGDGDEFAEDNGVDPSLLELSGDAQLWDQMVGRASRPPSGVKRKASDADDVETRFKDMERMLEEAEQRENAEKAEEDQEEQDRLRLQELEELAEQAAELGEILTTASGAHELSGQAAELSCLIAEAAGDPLLNFASAEAGAGEEAAASPVSEDAEPTVDPHPPAKRPPRRLAPEDFVADEDFEELEEPAERAAELEEELVEPVDRAAELEEAAEPSCPVADEAAEPGLNGAAASEDLGEEAALVVDEEAGDALNPPAVQGLLAEEMEAAEPSCPVADEAADAGLDGVAAEEASGEEAAMGPDVEAGGAVDPPAGQGLIAEEAEELEALAEEAAELRELLAQTHASGAQELSGQAAELSCLLAAAAGGPTLSRVAAEEDVSEELGALAEEAAELRELLAQSGAQELSGQAAELSCLLAEATLNRAAAQGGVGEGVDEEAASPANEDATDPLAPPAKRPRLEEAEASAHASVEDDDSQADDMSERQWYQLAARSPTYQKV